MNVMEEMCDRVIWIEGGRVKDYGKPADIVPKYKALTDA